MKSYTERPNGIALEAPSILCGGPVTVRHPEMTRYFMTVPEAAHLVLQAGTMVGGGEIFILDMGEPDRILNLAEETISLSGLRPYEDISIVFTGMRSGEKLFEQLDMKDEKVARTRHPKIFIGKIAAYPAEKVESALDRLGVLSRAGSQAELREFLNSLLPEARIDVSPGRKADIAARATVARVTECNRSWPGRSSLTLGKVQHHRTQ